MTGPAVQGTETPPRSQPRNNRLLNMSPPEMLAMAKHLARSGLLAKNVNTPEAVFAIIVAGQELGLTPMLALRVISVDNGKMTVDAGSQLGTFKRAGGRAQWLHLDDTRATVLLIHPNGDKHEETYTIGDARRAGLLSKTNWQKNPKAMLRSRCITAGLKSAGFEPVASLYDAEELEPSGPADLMALAEEAATDQRSGVAEADNGPHNSAAAAAPAESPVDTIQQAAGVRFPYGKHKANNTRVDQRREDGTYVVSDQSLVEGAEWLRKKRDSFAPGSDDEHRFSLWLDGIELEQDNRRSEDEDRALEAGAGGPATDVEFVQEEATGATLSDEDGTEGPE